jgi:hypothetical protein
VQVVFQAEVRFHNNGLEAADGKTVAGNQRGVTKTRTKAAGWTPSGG